MKQQTQLNEQYEKYFPSIERLCALYSGLSAPLLINAPQSYFTQNRKLMIIGQQTQGWGAGNIPDLLRCYEEFNFGASYYSSPFWNVTRKLENILGVDPYSIIWGNLNRCDFEEVRPSAEIELKLHVCFPVLAKEVEILKPDILVFFSGPHFDSHIHRSFPGCRLVPVQGFEESVLAKVEYGTIPYHSYRTYHPKYLRISGLEPRILEFVQAINT